MENKLAVKKYKSIVERGFKSFLELFLVCCYWNDKTLVNSTIIDFKIFNFQSRGIEECLEAFQLTKDSDDFCGKPISELDCALKTWYKNNNFEPYKKWFIENFVISKEEFVLWYKNDKHDRQCHYCKIKESEIARLIEANRISTKRLSTRGKYIEVDRLQVNKGYVKDNIAFCCYWCNNAKTDEFTEKEFKTIGKIIGETFRIRLAQIDKE